ASDARSFEDVALRGSDQEVKASRLKHRYRGGPRTVSFHINWDSDIEDGLSQPEFKGSEKVLKPFVAEDAGSRLQGGECGTALQAAAGRGDEEVVKMFIGNGADVNARGGDNETALQAASFAGSKEVVKLLIESGADVNAKGGR